jgi:hypothetical protein
MMPLSEILVPMKFSCSGVRVARASDSRAQFRQNSPSMSSTVQKYVGQVRMDFAHKFARRFKSKS